MGQMLGHSSVLLKDTAVLKATCSEWMVICYISDHCTTRMQQGNCQGVGVRWRKTRKPATCRRERYQIADKDVPDAMVDWISTLRKKRMIRMWATGFLWQWDGNALRGGVEPVRVVVPCYSLTESLIPRVREKDTWAKVKKGLVGGSENYSELFWKGKPMSLMKQDPGRERL